ncbi:MAG: hypothetical protein E7611_02280 [Ruminococcaceae bacterium]|nr:hypothetical protein [Oscillospiraceae bacterium]
MKKKLISLILVLSMVLTSALSFVSCNEDTQKDGETQPETSGEVVTEKETVPSTDETGPEGESKPEDETKPEGESNPEDETDLDSVKYENGEAIKGSGLKWDDEAFAAEEHEINESAAVDKTAAEMLTLLKDIDLMAEGEVYRVKEPLVLESNTKYYGNRASVIAEGGIVIKDASEIVIKELFVKGNVTVENSTGITFFKLDLKGGETGVAIDEASYDIAFKSCKIYASDTAIKTDADKTTVYQSYLSADMGLVASSDGVVIQDSQVVANAVGVSVCGEDCAVRNCLVEGSADSIGINVTAGAVNALVALNVVKDVQKSIVVSGGFNCVVLLNSAIRVIGETNTNLYVIENKLGGAIELDGNEYLICDGNTFNADGLSHPVIDNSNTEKNGNNIHDINARVEYGANEDILPHTNKDLFIDMERRESVVDISQTKSYGLANYIRSMAKNEPFVILPPGAYTSGMVAFEAPHSNTTLYAYGAYIERNGRDLTSNAGVLKQAGTVLYIQNASNITIKGVTIGYNFPSSGQVYVLDKIGNNQLLVIGNAGYLNDFMYTDPINFGTSTTMYKAGEFRPWNSLGSFSVVKNEDGTVKRDENGAFIIELGGGANNAAKLYSSIGRGDIFCCRLSGDNSSSFSATNSHNILAKDFVLYGYTSALAIVVGSRSTGVRLERLHNTVHSQPVIDEETYNKYAQLEETYGVDLEISIDEQGRFRGGLPRQGSVDATHITGSGEGVSATSCIFEQMCDDGSNQRGSSSRLAGYHDNGDGTTTIYYKGTISETYWNLNTNALKTTSTPTNTSAIKEGDRVYAYASNGHILFDTVALTTAKAVTVPTNYHVCHVDNLDNSTIKDGDVTDINGNFTQPAMCVDGLCDVCGNVTHYDSARDGKCDKCKAQLHVDWNRDGLCDISNCEYKQADTPLTDANGDGLNDEDGIAIVTDRFHVSSYSAATGKLAISASYSKNSQWYTIVYSTTITEIKVKTEDVNFDAFEGYDLTDNEYLMDDKILLDNLSANSIGFTFDNVLIQNKTSRGILCKTHDVSIKNCTFRGFSSTGVLLSVETSWGESTVPRNVNITGCLFDDTGRNFNTESNLTNACIAIQGLGANKATSLEVKDETLPCKDIQIIGNKFINTNNNYAISISAAQDIVILNNVFEARPEDTERRYGKAIYINGAMDLEIGGNTYSPFAKGDVTKAITALNYKNLTGADVKDVFPESKDPVPAQ